MREGLLYYRCCKQRPFVRNRKYGFNISLRKEPSAHQYDISLLFGRTNIEWIEKEQQEEHFGENG